MEQCVRLEEKSDYVKQSDEWMLKEVAGMTWVLKIQDECRMN